MANILLVDDDDNLLQMTGRFLRQADHSVTTAANGREAMRLFEQDAYDLVITDLLMPEQEGIETIMAMRRKIPSLKIIAISGGGCAGAGGYLGLAEVLGAAMTLAKPFSGADLSAAIAKVLAA